MTTSTTALNESWKTAIHSRPEGSFLFPENVVIEELMDHIDNTWTSLWEGQPTTMKSNTERTESSNLEVQTDPVEKRSWWKALRKAFKLLKKSESEMLDDSDARGMSRRFPSWVDWSKDEESRQ